MAKKPVQIPVDPLRTAHFRETARQILAKDRHNRKQGLTVDTAGAIAAALGRAYRQGFRDASEEPTPKPDQEPGMNWALIPPRAREAFWSICLAALGKYALSSSYLTFGVGDEGKGRWQLCRDGCLLDSFSVKAIKPLVHRRLLEPDSASRLMITRLGIETWERYIRAGGRFPDDVLELEQAY